MKKRLDILLLERGLVDSRTIAQTLIMDGQVYVNGIKIIKPSVLIEKNTDVIVKEKLKYVSRGALKIEKAHKEFNFSIKDKIALDIGSSTGGFTDFLIQNGAKKVYAVDVGYGQLDYKLRKNEKVVNLERINARYITKKHVEEKVDLIVIDTSFISVTKFIENMTKFLKEESKILILIKPQFEAGRKFVQKGGVVRDREVHKKVIENIINFTEKIGLFLYGLTVSPIKGPAGNTEYLALFGLDKDKKIEAENLINNIVGAG